MKNILLATTALVATAGFASAEIKFSGTVEGGFTRSAAVDAVAQVYGTQTTYSGSATTIVASTTAGSAATATTVAAALLAENISIAKATAAYNTFITATATFNTNWSSTTDTAAISAYNAAQNTYATALASRAQDAAEYAEQFGTAAVTAVAAGDIEAYSGYDFNVSMSATADNGMTFAAGFDMGAGSLADTTDDLALEAQTATIGTPTVTVGMNGFSASFGADNLDDLYDDSQNGDVSFGGTLGGFTFSVVTDLDDDTAAVAQTYGTLTAASATTGSISTIDYTAATFTAAVAASDAVWESTSYSIGTEVEGFTLSITGTDKNDDGEAAMKISASRAFGAVTAGLKLDDKGTADDITTLSLSYAGEGVSISASSDDNDDWDLSATLSSGVYAATFVTDEESDWNAQVSASLGGGASAFAYTDKTELFMAGVRFSF